MKKIYSKLNPDELLHIVFKKDEIGESGAHFDLIDSKEYLQVAAMKGAEGKKFPAHKHLPQDRQTSITQECNIIVSGTMKVVYYDTDNTILDDAVLEVGDCTITLKGGHSFSMEKDTLFYEIKNGPYLGREKDKAEI